MTWAFLLASAPPVVLNRTIQSLTLATIACEMGSGVAFQYAVRYLDEVFLVVTQPVVPTALVHFVSSSGRKLEDPPS